MQAVIDREYCLQHPLEIARFFGWDVALGMVLSGRKTLVQRLTDKYLSAGLILPGAAGNAYKLSALYTFRVGKVYALMAQRFRDNMAAHDLFADLQDEQMEQGRLVLSCLSELIHTPGIEHVTSVPDVEMSDALQELREIQARVAGMNLDEALATADILERGEQTVVFERLLGKVGSAEKSLFAERLRAVERHGESVHKRISAFKHAMQ